MAKNATSFGAAGGRKGGRPKGVPNKITAQVKDMVLHALARKGGVAYLSRQAEESPVAFLSLVRALLPIQQELSGKDGAPMTGTVIFQVVAAPDSDNRT